MIERKFRLVIERNGTSFSGDCQALIDVNVLLMFNPHYKVFSITIPKWMRDMLGDLDHKTVREKINEMGKDLYNSVDGKEIRIKL